MGVTINEAKAFTRPADTTAYAAGDLIANSVTAGDVEPLEFPASQAFRLIRQAQIHKTGTGLTGASFRLWLFDAEPVVTNGDNGALAGNWSANVVAVLEGQVLYAGTDGATGWLECAHEQPFRAGTLYGLLEARGAYTPVSEEVFTIRLEQVDA
jgi:hypothetical protein